MLIETKFFGPTNTKGARIKVTNFQTKQSKTYQWDHALDPEENHIKAFRMFLNAQYRRGVYEISQFAYSDSQSNKGLVFVSCDLRKLNTNREENNFQLGVK